MMSLPFEGNWRWPTIGGANKRPRIEDAPAAAPAAQGNVPPPVLRNKLQHDKVPPRFLLTKKYVADFFCY